MIKKTTIFLILIYFNILTFKFDKFSKIIYDILSSEPYASEQGYT